MTDQNTVAAEAVNQANESAAANSAQESPAVQPEAAEPQVKSTNGEAPAEAESSADNSTNDGVVTILNLQRGQYLKGQVKNIAQFGAFVDIGLPQDGLVHISELAKQKIDKVEDVVSVGQEVEVWVKKVDKKRGRISLTMVKPVSLKIRDIDEGAELEGTVTRLESYGAFVNIGSERDGLVHISQITHDYIKHPSDTLAVGDTVQVKVLKVNRKKRQIDLSIKELLPPPQEEIPQPAAVEEVVEEVIEEEPVPTAMALAYAAALQGKDKLSDADKEKDNKTRQKHKQEMDDIVSRTLATGE